MSLVALKAGLRGKDGEVSHVASTPDVMSTEDGTDTIWDSFGGGLEENEQPGYGAYDNGKSYE